MGTSIWGPRKSTGISVISATILLIIISIGIAMVLYTSFSAFTEETASEASNTVAGGIKILGVSFGSSGELEIYVINVGGRPVKIGTLYIRALSGNGILLSYNVNLTLKPGETGTITIPASKLNRIYDTGVSMFRINIISLTGESSSILVTNTMAGKNPYL